MRAIANFVESGNKQKYSVAINIVLVKRSLLPNAPSVGHKWLAPSKYLQKRV